MLGMQMAGGALIPTSLKLSEVSAFKLVSFRLGPRSDLQVRTDILSAGGNIPKRQCSDQGSRVHDADIKIRGNTRMIWQDSLACSKPKRH
jgi:hypothetical protein